MESCLNGTQVSHRKYRLFPYFLEKNSFKSFLTSSFSYVVGKRGDRGMGLKIIKLAVTSETKIATSPSVTRYFYELIEPSIDKDTLKIDAADFIDDAGNNVESLPVLNLNNSYFHVFINGVLQMSDHFAYTAGESGIGNLLVMLPEGTTLAEGTSFIIEVINFNPIFITTVGT